MKNHILEFFAEPAIGMIIGTNGYIWIEACRRDDQAQVGITEMERYQISVLRNAVVILDKAKMPIFKDSILKVIEEQQHAQIHPKDMFTNRELMLASATELINSEIS